MKHVLLIFIFIPFVIFYACNTTKNGQHSGIDADLAVKQMLEIGVKESIHDNFETRNLFKSIFPEPVGSTLTSIQQLGISSDLDRFAGTLSNASKVSAERSIPVFLNAIDHLTIPDAVKIIRSGGTSGTDYLRSSSETELRMAIRPVMVQALNEYKLNDLWNNVVNANLGGRVNVDLPNLMSEMVCKKMFQKIAETELNIRNNEAYRTTSLLQKAFSGKYF